MIVCITGPVRSGKSTRALAVARGFGYPTTHVVTARVDAADAEMADRIARHRADRGSDRTIELWRPGIPDLPAVIGAAGPDTTLLIDSLGTWLAGHLLDCEALAERDAPAALRLLELRCEPLFGALGAARTNLVIVAEETGWGVVPPSALGRIFRDALGRCTQRLARVADRVELVVAGYAVDLKRVGVAVTSDAAPATPS